MCVAYELPLDDIIDTSRFSSEGVVYDVINVKTDNKAKPREQVFVDQGGIIHYFQIKRRTDYIDHSALVCEFVGFL